MGNSDQLTLYSFLIQATYDQIYRISAENKNSENAVIIGLQAMHYLLNTDNLPLASKSQLQKRKKDLEINVEEEFSIQFYLFS